MRPLFVLFTLIFLLAPFNPTHAQSEWWEDGCDSRAMPSISATTDVINYEEACEHYRTCDPSGEGNTLCQLRTYQFMLEQCPLDDLQCTDGALLFAAAILAYDMPFGESISWRPPQTVIDGVPIGLEAFWNGDYQGALEAYSLTAHEDYELDTMMPVSRALLHMRLNQPEQAFAEFENAFAVVFRNPLAWIIRSELYGILGRVDEASFDVLALNAYLSDDPDLQPLVAPLQARYPLDTTVMQEWLVYPVSVTSLGVGGQFITDQTMESPESVLIGVYDDLNLMVLVGASQWLNEENTGRVVQVLNAVSNGERYIINYPEFWDNGGGMALRKDGDLFRGTEDISFFEGSASWQFMLAPTTEPDPRVGFTGTRHCGTALSFVHIGSQVRGVYWAEGIGYSDVPDGEQWNTLPSPDNVVTVVDGPVCVDGTAWWGGTSDINPSQLIWFQEYVDNAYQVIPTVGSQVLFYCPSTLASRLRANMQGRVVINGLGANNLREDPTVEAELLGTIPEGGVFNVIHGPVCAGGFVWYNVNYAGVEGWTVEGDSDIYWIEPITP